MTRIQSPDGIEWFVTHVNLLGERSFGKIINVPLH
jgi:hypothetical protein